MTTIIDYVVLNATFSSATINLVNLDSSVFFCLMLPWRAATEQSTFLTSLFNWSSWYDPMKNAQTYIKKKGRMQIYVLSQTWSSFEKVKGRV